MSLQCTASRALKRLRTLMGWTQVEAASFLGISKKAMESYEQGWRRVPDHLWQSLLTLVAVQRHYPHRYARCWEVMGCSDAMRLQCFSSTRMDGRFCWMTATTNCHMHHPELRQGLMTCICCPVVEQFLAAPPGRPAARRRASPRPRNRSARPVSGRGGRRHFDSSGIPR